MRISDCSSDVGSSDLDRAGPALRLPDAVDGSVDQPPLGIVEPVDMARHLAPDRLQHPHAIEKIILVRARQLRVDNAERESEDRRVGQVGDRMCTTLVSSYTSKNKKDKKQYKQI